MKALSKVISLQRSKWNQVPKPLQVFLIRGICALIAWKLLYIFLLQPIHQPDGVLTYFTAKATTWVFGLLSPGMQPQLLPQHDMLITAIVNGTRINTIMIADACNALELIVLQVGFILCMPIGFIKKLPYVLGGFAIIVAANILRCLALVYIYILTPNAFLFAHHYLFTLVIYIIIFITWMRFMKVYAAYAKKQTA